MGRLDLWESRLAELLGQSARRPFEWGQFDCCLLACDAIKALTGSDPGESYRGRYCDETSAREILDAEGGVEGIAERIARERGFLPVPPLFAWRGDIALADFRGRRTLGVCEGSRFVFPSVFGGLVRVYFDSPLILKVWRIG